MKKRSNSSLPMYASTSEKGTIKSHAFKKTSHSKTPFVEFNGAYIRKSTVLYLLQENFQMSNDRLLRVRSNQPSHLFSSTSNSKICSSTNVQINSLCFFRRIDNDEIILGRVVQFSYLQGSKKQREYSSSYVDTTLQSFKDIGVFANWFGRKKESTSTDFILFEPVDNIFTSGFLSMENFIVCIDESSVVYDLSAPIAIPSVYLNDILPNWNKQLTMNN